MGVVGVVVVRYQTAEAGRGNVPGEMATVLLLIARVATGGRGRKREGEQEEERQRPSMKPSNSRTCGAVSNKDSLTASIHKTSLKRGFLWPLQEFNAEA